MSGAKALACSLFGGAHGAPWRYLRRWAFLTPRRKEMLHSHQGGSPRPRATHIRYRIAVSLVLMLVLSLLLTSCDLFRGPTTVTPTELSPVPTGAPGASPEATAAGPQTAVTGQPQGRQPGLAAAKEVRGMGFYLSEGSTTPPEEERLPVAQGQPLGADEVGDPAPALARSGRTGGGHAALPLPSRKPAAAKTGRDDHPDLPAARVRARRRAAG